MQPSGDVEAVDRLVARVDADATDRSSIQELALLGAQGDNYAVDRFLEVVDRHGLIRPPIARQLFDAGDQDDVCQDVLLSLVRELPKFRGDAHVMTWLHRIATNAALGFVRRRQRRTEVHDQMPLTAVGRLSSIVADRTDLRDQLNDLPEPYREAVILRDIEGFAYKEIAKNLDLNLNTVRSHIARGRSMLADRIMPAAVDLALGHDHG